MSIDADIRAILEGARKTVAPVKAVNEEVEDEVETGEDEVDFDDLDDDQIVEGILALDELSKATLGSYVKKAAPNLANHATANGVDKGANTNFAPGSDKKVLKRLRGISKATSRLTKEQKETIESILEELENDQIVEDILALDELSKKTLGSYIKKAAHSAADKGIESGKNWGERTIPTGKAIRPLVKAAKRVDGIAKATDRLTKEQKETISNILEELSQEENEIVVDVSEDVNALLNGEDLTEEFKTKAATIFEAAVVTRVKDEVSKLEEAYETRLEEAVESIKEGLTEKVDGYLSYIVEKWIEDNEIALTNGVKLEVMESFVSGIKNVFEQNYIEVPEEKFDILGSMEERMADLESKLNESIEKNVALHTEIGSLKRESTISEAADGLTDTQVEKFKKLAEELSFEDEESFNKKLKTIRENYFTTKSSTNKQLTETFITDEPINEEVKSVKLDPKMSAYASAIK